VSDPQLDIVITGGVGRAPTPLAAFDAALQAAGVADFNLVRLSSLIPPGSHVDDALQPPAMAGRWGDRLYVVYAEHRVRIPGERACAALGWVQDDSGAGMLVEHHGHDETEVEIAVGATLSDLAARRPGRCFGPVHSRVTSIRCTDEPVAAVVVATFAAEGWES
jgi:arginine decarboxylase